MFSLFVKPYSADVLRRVRQTILELYAQLCLLLNHISEEQDSSFVVHTEYRSNRE